MKKESVPVFVKRLRRRLRLTQEQFAREVGVAFSTVNQWENGRRQPQPFLLKRLRDMAESLEKQDDR
jgi:transcriptional regulator with XRE-family HTH domain